MVNRRLETILMGEGDDEKCIFPLTSLQIGDLQSYLSELKLFLAHDSRKLYILVDNRPWLQNFSPRPAHLWQLMVTKSRLSPFANSKGRSDKKPKEASSRPHCIEPKKLREWVSLIDPALLSHKRVHIKKLQSSLFLNHGLHRTLYGFIVFEVSWDDVRGINYLNELQADTSLAIEAKFMRRWEFESIEQAGRCTCSWFSGTESERSCLKKHLNTSVVFGASGDNFYDAEEDFSRSITNDDDKIFCNDNLSTNEKIHHSTAEDKINEPYTPVSTGPCKRRRVTESVYLDETLNETEDTFDRCENLACDCEKITEATQYKDVFLLFKFNNRDLPFKLAQVILPYPRLLTLLEAGLPSWVMFLQSYPGFCHLYRPWMCPLARALYVLISVITVIIGFYDLYKNVPILKATASRLCWPLFDWIETWDMISRIRYLGTMLFLHNFQKAMNWVLSMACATQSFFSFLTVPLVNLLMEVLGFLLPIWNFLAEIAESFFSIVWLAIGSSCTLVRDVVEITLLPVWFFISLIWKISTCVFCPIFWILCEMLYAPIRLLLALANLLAFISSCIFDVLGDIWWSMSSIIRLASDSQTTVKTYEVSIWRSLWNDLFSQIFRAIRSILNGFVAFFATCNRHRLSIYNHIHELIQRLHGQRPISESSDSSHGRIFPVEAKRRVHAM